VLHTECWWGKPDGKKPLGKSRRRWKENIKKDLQEVGWRVMGSINLAQDRGSYRALVKSAMNLGFP
jgi:hypothetical protein